MPVLNGTTNVEVAVSECDVLKAAAKILRARHELPKDSFVKQNEVTGAEELCRWDHWYGSHHEMDLVKIRDLSDEEIAALAVIKALEAEAGK